MPPSPLRTLGAYWAHIQCRRYLVWAGLLLVLSMGLAFVPLFNSLGFEFALVFSPLASFAGADLAVVWIRRQRALPRSHPGRATSVLHIWFAATLCAAGLLLPPLLTID